MRRSDFSRPPIHLLLLLVFPLSACGGGSGSNPVSPTTPVAPQAGPPVVTYYAGTVATQPAGSAAGAITLRTTVQTTLVNGVAQPDPTGAATSILSQVSGADVTLYGTVTTATHTVTLSGGGYQLTATVGPNGGLSGSGTYGAGASLNSLATGQTAVSVSWLQMLVRSEAFADPPLTYCGAYSGTYVGPGGPNAESGGVCLTTTGADLSGSAGPLFDLSFRVVK